MGGDSIGDVSEIKGDEEFDLIVANIFARVHISLAHDFYKALRNTSTHSGILITSGYTSDREDDVTKAMNDVGFAVCDRAQIDEWIAIAFSKIYAKID
jgi:ribosomal protein L11 methyltransferase